MPASITAPGYWLVDSTGATGIVRYTQTGTLPKANSAAYLGAHSVNLANLNKAIGQTGAIGLYEYPGGLGALITDAEKKGRALVGQTPGVQADPTFTIIAGGLGGVAGGAAIAAGAAAEAAGGAAGAGAAEAGAAAGGAGGLASSAASKIASAATSVAGKDLAGATGLAAIVAAFGGVGPFLLRLVEGIVGVGLLFLAFKTFVQVGVQTGGAA